MIKFIKYFCIISLTVFSFYVTEKVTFVVKSKNPLYEQIVTVADNLSVAAIDAQVINDYIIPGVRGRKVNIDESYYEMQKRGVFNYEALVFDEILPNVSIDKFKDKAIISSNMNKKDVALIIENKLEFIEYFKKQSINVSILIDEYNQNIDRNFEYLNNETNKIGFENVESLLKYNKIDSKICLESNKNNCLSKKKYLVKPSVIVTIANYLDYKEYLNRGSIIYLDSSLTIDSIDYLITYIRFRDLNIVKLSSLIKE